jgi:hypothetical protein
MGSGGRSRAGDGARRHAGGPCRRRCCRHRECCGSSARPGARRVSRGCRRRNLQPVRPDTFAGCAVGDPWSVADPRRGCWLGLGRLRCPRRAGWRRGPAPAGLACLTVSRLPDLRRSPEWLRNSPAGVVLLVPGRDAGHTTPAMLSMGTTGECLAASGERRGHRKIAARDRACGRTVGRQSRAYKPRQLPLPCFSRTVLTAPKVALGRSGG